MHTEESYFSRAESDAVAGEEKREQWRHDERMISDGPARRLEGSKIT